MTVHGRSRPHTGASYQGYRPAAAMAVAFLALPLGSVAQTESQLRAYAVEIILFRPLQRSDLDERQWREAADATAAGDAAALDQLSAPLEDESAQSPSEPAPFADGFGYLSAEGLPPVYRYEAPLPERFADMAPDTRELSTLFDRLRRSSAYEPLLHERWMQLTYPRDVANPRPITLQRDDLSIDGTVKLAVERRLHLELSLTLSQAGSVNYELQQARVMTSGELHYVDHPAFGAVSRITPIELPEGYPDALLDDLLEDARLYGADPVRRMQSIPWPPPAPPPAEAMPNESSDETSGDEMPPKSDSDVAP
ncbi:MAG: CsiV family protein [Pseudomonadota bacterium]